MSSSAKGVVALYVYTLHAYLGRFFCIQARDVSVRERVHERETSRE